MELWANNSASCVSAFSHARRESPWYALPGADVRTEGAGTCPVLSTAAGTGWGGFPVLSSSAVLHWAVTCHLVSALCPPSSRRDPSVDGALQALPASGPYLSPGSDHFPPQMASGSKSPHCWGWRGLELGAPCVTPGLPWPWPMIRASINQGKNGNEWTSPCSSAETALVPASSPLWTRVFRGVSPGSSDLEHWVWFLLGRWAAAEGPPTPRHGRLTALGTACVSTTRWPQGSHLGHLMASSGSGMLWLCSLGTGYHGPTTW